MAKATWEPQSWLGAETLESVLEVNEQVLALLRAQSQAADHQPPLTCEVNDLLMSLDLRSLQRAAATSVLLVDAGFADPGLWSAAVVGAVNDCVNIDRPPFFTVDGSVALMKLVMTHTWHLARSQPTAARLLLGLSGANLALIGGCTLRRLTLLAETRSHWLRPRWENRPGIWRDLLRMAGNGESGTLERMRVRSLQLLAADARPG